MRVAVAILSLVLMLAVGLQSCAVSVGAASSEGLAPHILFDPTGRVLVKSPAPNG